MADAAQHIPVLLNEVLTHLLQSDDETYVDGTFGRGGHSRAMLNRLSPQGRLVVLDKDPQAITQAQQLAKSDSRVEVCHEQFSELARVLAALEIDDVAGVLLDVGVSSPQLDDASRGFSFRADGPLDMRMDPGQGISAAQWLNDAQEDEIAVVLKDLGEERFARRIARAIIAARPLSTTLELADLIEASVPRPRGAITKHPATRSFQAIRIHVNDEMGQLTGGLEAGFAALRPGGRLAVISFHSLEDRMVKHWFRAQSSPPPVPRRVPVRHDAHRAAGKLVTGPIRASTVELMENPRSRSATLRVLAKAVGDE